MRATDGAIEACVIDKDTMDPTFHIVGEAGQKPVGLCGSGIIDTISELYRCGIINAKGLFVRDGDRVARDRHGMGRYILAYAHESATEREIALNEVDIDNFIRAKGAIFSVTGAYAMVLSDQAAEKVDEVAKNMTYMELSTHPGYMDSFVAACFLPHTNRQLFPHSIQEI